MCTVDPCLADASAIFGCVDVVWVRIEHPTLARVLNDLRHEAGVTQRAATFLLQSLRSLQQKTSAPHLRWPNKDKLLYFTLHFPPPQ